METIFYVLIFGFLMSLIALVGVVTLFLNAHVLNTIMLPLIAFSAGSLIGGAMFHMIPSAVHTMGNETEVYLWITAGFALFLGTEQFLNWHHSHTHAHTCGPLSPAHEHEVCADRESQTYVAGLGITRNMEHNSVGALENGERFSTRATNSEKKRPSIQVVDGAANGDVPLHSDDHTIVRNSSIQKSCRENGGQLTSSAALVPASAAIEEEETRIQQRKSLGYLILLADAVHNFVGGLFVGASFSDSVHLGMTAWIAAAAHEIPQELGDFAILVHAGWSHSGALIANFFSALTFPLGMIISYETSKSWDVSFLIPFAAGNFLYIGATDLIPEVKHFGGIQVQAVNYVSFLLGLGLLLAIRIADHGW